MTSPIPPPEPRILLPPILACLPTAFVSPRPPPALLPLLSPILQQRVQIRSHGAASTDSWLPLLCWQPQQAAKLPDVVQNIQIEPHPVSGEVEIEDVDAILYRRLDEETLHAKIDVEQFGLLFIYLWCPANDDGAGTAWKLAELRSLEDGEDGSRWFDNVADANEASGPQRPRVTSRPSNSTNDASKAGTDNGIGVDDDDDYWAAYDQTPGRTPAKQSPAPPNPASVPMPSGSELEYFARYVAEVQPAMDPHDPSEQGLPPGESTLNGDNVIRGAEHGVHGQASATAPTASANGTEPSTFLASKERQNPGIDHPRPSSSSSGSVDRLELHAKSQSQAELAVKQHISTDMKSLYRLARGAGIDKEEFERIIRTELDCLSLMDLDE